jgi:hypothetical protein
MLVQEYAAHLALNTDRAREDSLVLWRNLEAVSGKRFVERSSPSNAPCADIRPLNLPGRYRVGDGNEFPCVISDLTPAGIRVRGPKSGGLGKWCTTSITSVGIVEGVVVEARQSSFVVGVIAPSRRLRRLAHRLHWQTLRNDAKVKERRTSERIDMNKAKTQIETDDGRVFPCEIFDLSEGGAALQLGDNALYFWIDQPVRICERFGRVLRHFPGGVVIKFD